MPAPPRRFTSGGLSHLGVRSGPGRCPRTGGPVPRAEGRTGRVPVSCSLPGPADLGYKVSASSPGRLRSRPRVSACPRTGFEHLSVSGLSSRRFLAGDTLMKAPRVTEDSNPIFIILSPPRAFFPTRGIAAVLSPRPCQPGSPRHFSGHRLLGGIRYPR